MRGSQGWARPGSVGPGQVWQSRSSMAWLGEVRLGMAVKVGQGGPRSGLARHGTAVRVRRGMVGRGRARQPIFNLR